MMRLKMMMMWLLIVLLRMLLILSCSLKSGFFTYEWQWQRWHLWGFSIIDPCFSRTADRGAHPTISQVLLAHHHHDNPPPPPHQGVSPLPSPSPSPSTSSSSPPGSLTWQQTQEQLWEKMLTPSMLRLAHLYYCCFHCRCRCRCRESSSSSDD